MNSLIFDMKVPIGMFREPGTRFYASRSLPVPPVSAIMGMLLAISGKGRGEFGVDVKARDEFVRKILRGTRIGIRVMREPESATFGVKDFTSSRVPWQIIVGGHYRIAVLGEDGWFKEIGERIQKGDYVFPPYAGMTSYPVILSYVEGSITEYEGDRQEIDVASGLFITGEGIVVGSGVYNISRSTAPITAIRMSMFVFGYGGTAKPAVPVRFAFSTEPITIKKVGSPQSQGEGRFVYVDVGSAKEVWMLSPPMHF